MSKLLNITLPESWAQLSEHQIDFVSKLIYMGVPELELITRCFLEFAGITILSKDPEMVITENAPEGELCYWFKKKGTGKFCLDVDMSATLIHHLDFLRSGITLFKNPAKIGKYTGCNFKLYGLSLEEWLIVDQMYIGYAKTKNIRFLDNMLAVLYTLPGEKWDESTDLDKRAARFTSFPEHTRYIIFLWYTACKLWLKVKYPYLFETSGSSDSQESANDYVLALLSSLNEGNVANNILLKKSPCHEIFFELNRKIEKAKTF